MDSEKNHQNPFYEGCDYFKKGEQISQFRPGDFILTHGSGFYAGLITFGQSLRFRGSDAPFAKFNHAAEIVSESGDIVEALGTGVVRNNISKYTEKERVIVRINASLEDRAQMVSSAEGAVGKAYGWIHIFSLALTLLLANKVDFGVKDQLICSGLVAKCLEKGWMNFEDCGFVMPADLAKLYNIIV